MEKMDSSLCMECGAEQPAITALRKLIQLGLVEACGPVGANPVGIMEETWQASALGRTVIECAERMGLTLEQAWAMVTEANGGHMN